MEDTSRSLSLVKSFFNLQTIEEKVSGDANFKRSELQRIHFKERNLEMFKKVTVKRIEGDKPNLKFERTFNPKQAIQTLYYRVCSR